MCTKQAMCMCIGRLRIKNAHQAVHLVRKPDGYTSLTISPPSNGIIEIALCEDSVGSTDG